MSDSLLRLLHRPAVVVALALFGCAEDPSAPGPCDGPRACEVQGPDLAIVSAEIEFHETQRHRSEVDAHVVLPGATLPVRLILLNRGSELTAPARVVIEPGEMVDSLAVPALDPGEYFRRTVRVIVPEHRIGRERVTHLSTTLRELSDSTCCWQDADPSNDALREPGYHILVPFFSARIELPDTIRALQPYHVTVRLTNESPFVAQHDPLELGFCFFDDGYSCPGPAGEVVSVPPIMAGETRTIVAHLVTPHDPLAIEWVDGGGLAACLLLPYLLPEQLSQGCLMPGGRFFYVLPNLEAACSRRVLAPPDAFDPGVGKPGCRHQSDHYWQSVVALDAAAGERFELTVDNPSLQIDLLIVDLDARSYETTTSDGAILFEAPATRRYYLVTRKWDDVAGLVHIARVP